MRAHASFLLELAHFAKMDDLEKDGILRAKTLYFSQRSAEYDVLHGLCTVLSGEDEGWRAFSAVGRAASSVFISVVTVANRCIPRSCMCGRYPIRQIKISFKYKKMISSKYQVFHCATTSPSSTAISKPPWIFILNLHLHVFTDLAHLAKTSLCMLESYCYVGPPLISQQYHYMLCTNNNAEQCLPTYEILTSTSRQYERHNAWDTHTHSMVGPRFDTGTLLSTMLYRLLYIAYKCSNEPRCTKIHVIDSNKQNRHQHTPPSPAIWICANTRQYASSHWAQIHTDPNRMPMQHKQPSTWGCVSTTDTTHHLNINHFQATVFRSFFSCFEINSYSFVFANSGLVLTRSCNVFAASSNRPWM